MNMKAIRILLILALFATALDACARGNVSISSASSASTAGVGSPVLYFSDLLSGPATGNSDTSLGQTINQHGTIVTVWGRNLGTSQGASTIKIGGVNSPFVYYWGNAVPPWDPADLNASHGMQIVIFQVPNTVASGLVPMQATVGGVASTTLPFTVRSGRILFLDRAGSNANPGTFQSPWHDHTVLAGPGLLSLNGDVVYARGGTYTEIEASSASLYLAVTACTRDGGAAGNPKALVAYPGETAILGDTGSPPANTYSANMSCGFWTLGKLTFSASSAAITEGKGDQIHIVGNTGSGFTNLGGGVASGKCGDCQFLGNHFFGSGSGDNSHLIYYGGGDGKSNVEIAWNHLHDSNSGRCIQVYGHFNTNSLDGFLKIHDNIVYECLGGGILASVGDGGTPCFWIDSAYIYNNVVWHAAMQTPSRANDTGKAGMRLGSFSSPANCGGVSNARVFNNTFFDNGHNHIVEYTEFPPEIRNNIFANPVTAQVLTSPPGSTSANAPMFSNNLYAGTGGASTPPSLDTVPITASSANFLNQATFDLHLQSTGPALNVGTSSVSPVVTYDLDGNLRPQGSGWDVGAYEFSVSGGGGFIDNIPPTVPANFMAVMISSTRIDLSWSASSDNVAVAGYVLRRCRGSGCSDFKTIATVPESSVSYSDNGLDSGFKYRYAIRAID